MLKTMAVEFHDVCAKSEPGSSVSIVTGNGLGHRGLIPDRGGGFFLYPLHPVGSGVHSDSCTVGTSDLPRGINAAGVCC
jgi:hypothetical protein